MGYIFKDDPAAFIHNAKLTPETVAQARAEYKAAQVKISELRKSCSVAAFAQRHGVGVSIWRRLYQVRLGRTYEAEKAGCC